MNLSFQMPANDFEAKMVGRQRELKFLHIWRTRQDLPAWFQSVRDATRTEDRRGHTDAFIKTWDREIPIQIKGSYRSIAEFETKFGENYPEIVTVLVNERMTHEQVIRSTLIAIYGKHPDLRKLA